MIFLTFYDILLPQRIEIRGQGSMAKVIKVENEIVLIGADDGSIQEVRRSYCDFNIAPGDEVEVFSNGTKTIVIKKKYN